MSNALIRAAFESALKTWADAQAPALSVAWENVPFTPTSSLYLRSFLLPADTGNTYLAGNGREYRGVYQVTIVLPAGIGQGGRAAIEAALDSLYPTTAPIDAGGLNVWITSPMSAGPAIQETDRYAIPVSCGYQSHLTT